MIIRNAMYGIYGFPGSGKSMFAQMLGSLYPRIYSNLDIKRYGKSVTNFVESIDYIKTIPFSEKKGVLIIEEAGINTNSRRSLSEENAEFNKMSMLARKKNLDIIQIAQLDFTVDKVLRSLCHYTFHMQSFFDEFNGLMFSVMIKDRHDQILGMKELDMLEYMRLTGYSYETLDEGIIEKSQKRPYVENKTEKKDFSPGIFLTA